MAHQGRLIVSIAGHVLTDDERKVLKHPMLAGIILFAKNYKNKQQIQQLISDIHSTVGYDLPVFIDQEGGAVQRFGLPDFTLLPTPKVLGAAYDINNDFGLELAKKYGSIMAQELNELKVTSLSPVCDLAAGNPVISGLHRAYHAVPEACYKLLDAVINGMQEKGMNATGKHFPGHGQYNGDTHLSVVYDHRPLEEIEQNDLVPFINLIRDGRLAAIMPSHIIYTQVDPNNTAGSSKVWLNDLLRDKYGFKGVIVSDCLSMRGAGDDSLLNKTIKALAFGDVAIMCHQPVAEVIKVLNGLVSEGLWLSETGQERMAAWTSDPRQLKNYKKHKL